jgi:ribonuclease P protein component
MLKQTVTIKSNCDFRRVYGKGKSFQGPALVSYVLKNRAGICRIGITTSKKTGNAVERNRSRRVIRAAYSMIEDKITFEPARMMALVQMMEIKGIIKKISPNRYKINLK